MWAALWDVVSGEHSGAGFISGFDDLRGIFQP